MPTIHHDAPSPKPGDTLVAGALKVLQTADPHLKVQRGADLVHLWQSGAIAVPYDDEDRLAHLPNKPARDATVRILAPGEGPKRGRGGSLSSRQALLHSLVHIESWAVDLSWDIIARFGRACSMPREFFDDFVKVADDEGRHFQALEKRLQDIGSYYGAFPAHDGLWESASETANDLMARLAVEHCVHEARGLDVVPQTIARFRSGGDPETADLLEKIIYPEEITHCATGVKWFTYLCRRALEAGVTKEEGAEPSGETGSETPAKVLRIEERAVMTAVGRSGIGDTVERGSDSGQSGGDAERRQRKGDSCIEPIVEAVAACTLGIDVETPESSGANAYSVSNQNEPLRTLDGSACSSPTAATWGEPPSGSCDGIVGGARRSDLSESELKRFVVSRFHEVVRRHFRGPLKPPFNKLARAQAGFDEEWYLPLANPAS